MYGDLTNFDRQIQGFWITCPLAHEYFFRTEDDEFSVVIDNGDVYIEIIICPLCNQEHRFLLAGKE